MKKLSTSVSPFLMMIIPVILFVGLSLAGTENQSQEEFSGNSLSVKNATTTMVKVGEQSLMRFLLRK
ncbi:hypothetical protein [Pedobacter cryophilus]|uniref:Uncharacterized protein n=1 Tax=Pedobacter cryophilus TaxID=2571271 RepID=A0A4U1C4Q3_9SPHI|nr:hypothetical protein [Pedobacter cryophilus]TKC00840.1 hypothetical protein FA046_03960 [Pedobacter cryophilus]